MNNKILLWVMCTMFSSECLVASKQPKKPKAVAASPVKGKQSAKKSKQQYDSEDELLDQKSAETEQFQQQQEQQRLLKLQKEQQAQQEEQKFKAQTEKNTQLVGFFKQALVNKDLIMLQELHDQGFDFNIIFPNDNQVVVFASGFFAAVEILDISILQFLLDHGADVNLGCYVIRRHEIVSVLYRLVQSILLPEQNKLSKGLPVLEFLLNNKVNPDIGVMLYNGSDVVDPDILDPRFTLIIPVLAKAIDAVNVEIVKMLLGAGANSNIPYLDVQTGLEMSLLSQAISHKVVESPGMVDIIQLLLRSGADINKGKSQGSYRISPLYCAVEKVNLLFVNALLEDQKNSNLDVNLGYQYEQYYVTPLSKAIAELNFAQQHHIGMHSFIIQEIIKLLVKAGTDVNKGSYLGAYEVSPLQDALVLEDYKDVCDVLLQGGADVNIPNSITGLTLPFEKVTTYMDLRSRYPDHTDFLRELREKLYYVVRLESYVDVFHEVQGYNILDSALWHGLGEQEPEIIKILIHKGLNPTVKNRDGKNTYDKLIELGRSDLIKKLNAILDTMGADFVAMQYVEPLIKQEQLTDLVQDEPVSPVVSASTSPVTSPTKTELKKQKKAEKLEKKALMVEQESKQVVEPKVIETTILPKAKSPARLREMTIESIKISRGVDVADRQQALQVVEKALRVTPIDPALIAKYLTLQNNKTIKNIDWIHILLPVVDMVYSLRLKKYNPSFSGSHTSRAIDSLVQAQCVESMQEEVMDNGCVVCRLKNLFTGDFFIKTIFPKSWTDEQIMKSVTVADIKNSVIDSKTGNIEMSLAFQDPQTAKTILMRAIAVKDFVLGMLKIITVYPVKSFDDQEKTLQAFAGHTVPAIA